MSTALNVLCVIAPIGAIDVLYYHLFRFRLFERRASLGEEVTHLVRQACFLCIVALLAGGTPSTVADYALVALLLLDLVNSAIDVALEPRSRAALGGLPRGEALLHFLGSFGSGLATAAYFFERGKPFAAAPAWQVAPLLVTGALLLFVELGLFLRAQAGRPSWFQRCCEARSPEHGGEAPL